MSTSHNEHHQEEEEEAWNVEFHSTPKEEVQHVKETGIKDSEKENVKKGYEVTLSESMLDDVLLEGY